MKSGLKKAIDAVGSSAALANALKLDRSVVHRWKDIPPHWIIRIEHLTGVPREELRPDLYLAPRPRREP